MNNKYSLRGRLLLVLLVIVCSSSHATKVVMPWICLERCGGDIQAEIDDIVSHANLLTAVSFEAYELGPDSQFNWNGFTVVGPTFQKLGLKTYPMITTGNLTHLRQAFQNPQPFIDAAVKTAVENNWTGYDIDFEPDDHGTAEDAQAYATWLTLFANALHAQQKELQVCIASWNAIWDFSLLANTTVDKYITMDTYAGDMDVFLSSLDRAMTLIGPPKVGIGLEFQNPNPPYLPFSDAELFERFYAIQQYGEDEIYIWAVPLPGNWWQFLDMFFSKKK